MTQERCLQRTSNGKPGANEGWDFNAQCCRDLENPLGCGAIASLRRATFRCDPRCVDDHERARHADSRGSDSAGAVLPNDRYSRQTRRRSSGRLGIALGCVVRFHRHRVADRALVQRERVYARFRLAMHAQTSQGLEMRGKQRTRTDTTSRA
jgi:hypothetical protein